MIQNVNKEFQINLIRIKKLKVTLPYFFSVLNVSMTFLAPTDSIIQLR